MSFSRRLGGKALVVGTTAVILVGAAALPASAVYPIINPPSAPTNVVAVPGNAKASVAWQVPASNGGSPITGYRVTSTPASTGCNVGAAVLTCEVTGLTNGTSYVFSVQATNVAGTGAAGVSNAVTPQDNIPTITIGGVRSQGNITVQGQTVNIPQGAVLASFVRVEGNSSFDPGGPASVAADGSFAWSTTVPATKGVEVYFSYQGTDSNVVSLAADAQTSLAIGGSRSGTAVSISGLSTNIPAGSSVSILTRVNGRGDFAAAGTATVGADGRFTWTGSQAVADRIDVVAEFGGLRSNVLSFPGDNIVSITISGSRSANGRSVTISGATTGIPAGSSVVPTVTLDGSPVSGRNVAVESDGRFQWQRSVGAQRTVVVSFSYSGTSSNVVTLVPGEPTIGIAGSRSGGTVTITGESSLNQGDTATAYVRVEGDVGFTPNGSATVRADGSFTWSRQLAASRGIEVYFVGGGATSNTVFLPATASTIVITGTRIGTTVSLTGVATGLASGSQVTLRSRVFGDSDYSDAGTGVVGADGSFALTTTVALDQGVSVYVKSGSAESNVLSFNPLAAAIVLFGGSFQSGSEARVTAYGQAYNVPAGTVLVPFVSLDGGAYVTGTGVRTLNEQGEFTWTRRVNSSVTSVDVYFATVDGVTSNTLNLGR